MVWKINNSDPFDCVKHPLEQNNRTVKNPVTGEEEVIPRSMQEVRDSDGRLLLDSKNNIVIISHDAQLEILMRGEGANVLKCQAMVACMGNWSAPGATVSMPKPHLPSSASFNQIKIYGNGWYLLNSPSVVVPLGAASYIHHSYQCSTNSSVIASCGG